MSGNSKMPEKLFLIADVFLPCTKCISSFSRRKIGYHFDLYQSLSQCSKQNKGSSLCFEDFPLVIFRRIFTPLHEYNITQLEININIFISFYKNIRDDDNLSEQLSQSTQIHHFIVVNNLIRYYQVKTVSF